MIGQKKLLNSIDSLKSLPHSILLLGEYGSEQEDICEYISDKFNLLSFDMTQTVTQEFISQIYSSHCQTLYIVDLSKLGDREQNMLLKLFEEPTDYAYLILLAESDSLVLDTIKSRSFIMKADQYSKKDLKNLIVDRDENLVLSICTTPGQVQLANRTNMDELNKLCNTIYDCMSNSNYANALSIANKINFKDSYEKFDLYLFIKTMKYTLLTRGDAYNFYYNLHTMSKFIFSMNDKKLAFENFITKIWKSSRLV